MNIKRINQITARLHKLKLKEAELIEELCILIKEDSSTSKARKVISNKDNNRILINGIYWDKENLISDSEYFTFDEAQKSAKAAGKRCPTTEEFIGVINLGYTWDEEKKGIWVAGNHATDHKGSLWFPAAGLRNNSSGGLGNSPSGGYYWSSSIHSSGSSYGGYLNFYSNGGVYPQSSNSRSYGFSVRCVSDITE